jgi:hypothetical protein
MFELITVHALFVIPVNDSDVGDEEVLVTRKS